MTTIESKICSACSETKPLSDFSTKKSCVGGVNNLCRKCINARAIEYRIQRKLNPKVKKTYTTYEVFAPHEHLRAKTCIKCMTIKPVKDFGPQSHSKNKISNKCKDCAKNQKTVWRLANFIKTKESTESWRTRNPEKVTETRIKYRKEHPDKLNADCSKRRARKLNAVVAWADNKLITELYALARKLTDTTGVNYQVDHIIPLVHPLVCGLHVENNLQILTAFENASKHNKFDSSNFSMV